MIPSPLEDITEKSWQSDVVKLATMFGYRVFHPYDSRRSERGWPDLALVKHRLILIELKREKGKCTDAQKGWLRALVEAGQEVYVARPRNEPEVAAILASPVRFDSALAIETEKEIV